MALVFAAAASARSPLVIHPKWKLAWSGGITGARADGRYVLLSGPFSGVLIDDMTGRQTALGFGLGAEGPCGVDDIGGGWVAAACTGTNSGGTFAGAQLYSIAGRAYRLVQAPNREPCGGYPSICSLRVGRHWIEWADIVHFGPGVNTLTYRYQNIASGQVVPDPTTTKIIPDLNLPNLTRRVCDPLTVPRSSGDHITGLGSLQFVGRYAIATSRPPSSPLEPPVSTDHYLERCGSKLHIRIGDVASFSPHLIVWNQNQPGRASPASGVMLPSLRRVRIQLPALTGPEPAFSITLASRHMYLVDADSGKVWIAGLPHGS